MGSCCCTSSATTERGPTLQTGRDVPTDSPMESRLPDAVRRLPAHRLRSPPGAASWPGHLAYPHAVTTHKVEIDRGAPDDTVQPGWPYTRMPPVRPSTRASQGSAVATVFRANGGRIDGACAAGPMQQVGLLYGVLRAWRRQGRHAPIVWIRMRHGPYATCSRATAAAR
jgi:hypothetical protein